jgi:hypothetical protein
MGRQAHSNRSTRREIPDVQIHYGGRHTQLFRYHPCEFAFLPNAAARNTDTSTVGQNGLNVPERIDFGGWGGRYKKLLDPESQHYHDSNDQVISPVDGKKRDGTLATLWRWRPEVQNDFAARMQ